MIFIVTKGQDVENNEEIKVNKMKDKSKAAAFIEDWESQNANESESEIIGIFEGKELQYSTTIKVDVKFT